MKISCSLLFLQIPIGIVATALRYQLMLLAGIRMQIRTVAVLTLRCRETATEMKIELFQGCLGRSQREPTSKRRGRFCNRNTSKRMSHKADSLGQRSRLSEPFHPLSSSPKTPSSADRLKRSQKVLLCKVRFFFAISFRSRHVMVR